MWLPGPQDLPLPPLHTPLPVPEELGETPTHPDSALSAKALSTQLGTLTKGSHTTSTVRQMEGHSSNSLPLSHHPQWSVLTISMWSQDSPEVTRTVIDEVTVDEVTCWGHVAGEWWRWK